MQGGGGVGWGNALVFWVGSAPLLRLAHHPLVRSCHQLNKVNNTPVIQIVSLCFPVPCIN